jgi:tetratricopeptide (TPR) repeat protein
MDERQFIEMTVLKNVSAQNITIGDVKQTINVPRKSTAIPSDVRQGSPNFVGRLNDLQGLHEALQKEGIVSVCAVRGMGGVGKTELAIQYAMSKEFQQRYVACYWFSLNEGNLASLILQKAAPYLAMPEEIQKSDDVYEQVKWCWQNWHPDGEVLVILDDVKDLNDIPKKAMPINPRFKVMLTTRQRNLSPSFQELMLGVLPEDEALELLQRIVDRDGSSRIEDELETAKEICRYLGYLPLALELAATYLVEDEMLTLGEYWQQLNLQDRSISDEMVKYITAERGVVSAFALSWLRLRDLSPQVAMLLGRFAPADIPWEDLVEPTVKSLGWDEAAVRKGRVQLTNLHLISIREQKNIGIHSLLREYFRWQSDQEGNDFVNFLQRAIVETGISISKTIPKKSVKADIERVRLAIPHLEMLSRQMLNEIVNPESDLLWAFIGVAFFYMGQGLYSSTIPLLQNCLSAIESRFRADHPNVATSLNNLAGLYELQGKYDDAEPLYLRSLSIREGQISSDSLSVAQSLNNLAGLYREQGYYSKAEPLYVRALSILENQIGTDHALFSQSLNDFALLHQLQGKYNDAENLYLRSLSIWERQLGADHPDVATSLNNLAGLYELRGKYNEAESLYLRSLSIWERQLGADHPDVATSLNNLANLYRIQGKFSESEPLYLRSLSIWEQKLGTDHLYITINLNNLALLYEAQGNYAQAESLYLRSLFIREQQLGTKHPKVATSLNNLANLYRMKGKYTEAEPLFLRLIEIDRYNYGDFHPDVATSLNNLALLYDSQGKYEDAEILHQKALTMRQKLLGDNHPDVANSLNNIAIVYYSQERYKESETLFQQALTIFMSIFGEHHPDTQNVINSLITLRLQAFTGFKPTKLQQVMQDYPDAVMQLIQQMMSAT